MRFRDTVFDSVSFVTMPPHSSSNYLAMPTKIMKSPPGTPSAEESELRSPLAGPAGDKKATWKAYRKTTSKITPKQPSPIRAPSEKAKTSKSGNTTPTKELKSCLKKPSDGSQKSGVSSPLQSYRSELTQHSHRSEFNESMFDNSLSASLSQDPDDEEAKDLNMTQQETWLTDPTSSSEPLDDVPLKRDSKGSRKKEIPTSFIDAFLKDEDVIGDSPPLGPYLIKLAKSQASGENPVKALEYCIRAVKFYERNSERESSLDLVISLHILATLHCQLGQYEDAVGLLERSLKIPDLGQGEEHALATFSGHMQLGDTLNLGGKQKLSIESYQRALEVQKLVLGEFDNRVAETCNYIAEAHLQAMEFEEAEKLCAHSLLIHTEHCKPGSLEEAADRRLLALIFSARGEHGKALDCLVYANDILVNYDREIDVATVNRTIGDELLALGRDAEALLCFSKVVTDFKSLRGDNHSLVASAYVRLADLYLRTNKPHEAKVNCERALCIYGKQGVGHMPADVGNGLMEIASVLEQLNERETALLLLQRAYIIEDKLPGQQATVAGIEGQIGLLHYMMEKFRLALYSLQSAVEKLKGGAVKHTPLLGMMLNHMGLCSIELGEIQQALCLFEEAKGVMEETCGPHHLDTMDVCNNLASTYQAVGRSEDAFALLEEVVQVKAEKLGTTHPEVQDDRQRLQEMLDQAGRTTTYKKSRKLVDLLSNARKTFHSSK